MSELLSVDVAGAGSQQLAAAPPVKVQQVTKAPGGGPIRVRPLKSNHGLHRALPNRPKKANSPYTLFIQGFYKRNQKSKMSPRDKFTQAVAEWKKISKADREELEKNCARDRERYNREMTVWKSQKDFLKRPPTNYGLFLKDTWTREKAAGRGRRDEFVDISRQASDRWSELSKKEKQGYTTRYQGLRECYKGKLREVEATGSLPDLNWANRQEVLNYTPSRVELNTAEDDEDDDYDDEEDEDEEYEN